MRCLPLALSLWLYGCGSAPPDSCDASSVASTFLCHRDFEVEVGTGEEGFESLGSPASGTLYRGSQGAQHVVVSLRAMLAPEDLALPRSLVSLSVLDPDNGVPLSEPVAVGLPLESGEKFVDVVGYYYIISVPDQVVGREVLLTAELQPVGAGVTGRGAAVMSVSWAPGDTASP